MRPYFQSARGFALQVGALTYSLTAGAFYSNPPSAVNEPEGFARLGIAVGAGVLALAIRSRAARRRELSPTTLLIDFILAYGCVIVSQVILGWLRPSLVLPNWAPTQGGYVGCMLFMATRAMLAFHTNGDDFLPEWDKTCRRYRMLYGIAGVAALTLGLAGLTAVPARAARIASGLLTIGSAYLTFLVARGLIDQSIGSCKAILRGAAVWYYGALFPASLVALFGSKVYLYWVPLVILLFAEANQRASRSLAKYSLEFKSSILVSART